MIGQTISHYKILEKLGEGGMGEVYKAQDLEHKRIVALKFLPRQRLGNEHTRARFLREAEAAAAVNHPNICTVYEVVEMEEYTFISMAFIGGRSLDEVIRSGPVDTRVAVDYAIQIAEGLQVAHANQIIHRDIKSSNIMVTTVGGVRITDFGQALLPNRTRVTKDGLALGTVAYMSPEQINGTDVDHQTDIWSLGVLLYEMIARRLPFQGKSDSAIVTSILNDAPPALTTVRPDTPGSIDRVVSKAMSRSWEERYQNTAELLDDLRGIRASLTAEASRTAVAEAEKVEAAAAAPVEEPEPQKPAGPGLIQRFRFNSRITWIAAAAIVAFVAVILWLNREPAVGFVERDRVLISDFTNMTDETVIDRSLDMALLVTLDQSPYVNVVPRRRSEDALRRMKMKDVEFIDPETAREIAMHEDIKILVVPSINKVGDTYTLTSVIQDAATGDHLRTDMIKATGQDEVLGALDELAGRIRAHLGEGDPSISRTSEPLEKIATASLEALRQYSMGFDKNQKGRFEEAKLHYEYALDEDSLFVIAAGALGMLEYLHFDRFKGMDYLNAALDMVNETTEPEAFAIRAAHAIAVEQDYEKAAQLYETILRKYPDATTLRNNLGAVYGVLGRHKDAVTEYREAIRAEPTLMTSYNGLVTEYLDHLGRVDLALVWLRRQMAYQPESALPYTNLAYAYVGADSLDKAAAALEQALVFDAEFSPGLELLGHLLWLEGRYDESLVMFARILAANPDAVEPHYYMGVVYQSKGAGTTALDHFDRFRRVSQWRTEDNPDNAGYFFDLGVVLTRMGQPTRSRAAGERAAEISPTAYFDLVRLYSVQGRADEAFELLDRAAGSGFRDFVTLKYHPDFKNLRNDPRLVRLLDAYLKV